MSGLRALKDGILERYIRVLKILDHRQNFNSIKAASSPDTHGKFRSISVFTCNYSARFIHNVFDFLTRVLLHKLKEKSQGFYSWPSVMQIK